MPCVGDSGHCNWGETLCVWPSPGSKTTLVSFRSLHENAYSCKNAFKSQRGSQYDSKATAERVQEAGHDGNRLLATKPLLPDPTSEHELKDMPGPISKTKSHTELFRLGSLWNIQYQRRQPDFLWEGAPPQRCHCPESFVSCTLQPGNVNFLNKKPRCQIHLPARLAHLHATMNED